MDEGLFVYYNYSHFAVQVPPPRGEQEGGLLFYHLPYLLLRGMWQQLVHVLHDALQ